MSDSVWIESWRPYIQPVLDAMDEMFRVSTADAWPSTRAEYGRLRRDLEPDQPSQSPADVGRAQWDAADAVRDALSMQRREELALEAFAETGGLTISELTDRLNERVKTPACGTRDPFQSGVVRAVVMRLVAAGRLVRGTEEFRGQVRLRFTLPLTGTIAALEDAMREGE